jgi:glycosyltransferase involved in cell wall biosynthesis
MRIAIVIPMRRGKGSGGFHKHLKAILPLWARSGRVQRLAIVSDEAFFASVRDLEVSLEHVTPERSGRKLRWRRAARGFDAAFCPMARPVDIGALPLVTMVRNSEPIQPRDYRASPLWYARLLLLRRECRLACEQAARIIAVSNYVRQRLLQVFRLDASRIDVVHHGHDLGSGCTPRQPKMALPAGERFLFSAGSIVPYRGLEDLIRATARLRRAGQQPLPVVHAGADLLLAADYSRHVRRLAVRLGVADLFFWAGSLSAAEMAWCYRNAVAFVQTSHAEACPNIVLEAMSHGCLIVSTTRQPMPELLGDAALYFDSADTEQLIRHLARLDGLRPEEQAQLREAAVRRVAAFGWEQTASRTLDVLAKVAGKHRE